MTPHTAWTTKEEREYAELRDELVEQGLTEKHARERAAQMVNDHHRHEGESADGAHPDGGDVQEQTITYDRITQSRQPQPNGRRMHAPGVLHQGNVQGHGHRISDT